VFWFSKLDWADHEEVLATVKIIQHLGSLALFPRGNRALHSALKPEYEFPSFLGKGMATGIIGKMWFHLWQGTRLMNTVLSVPPADLRGVVICDNRFHDPVAATGRERSFGRSRSCSGCHLVVYCGETCQQQDWNERHKYECKSMKRTLDTRKRETVHYSQANRHLHVQMIMEFFCSDYMSILSQFGERAPPSECILVIDAHSGLDWPRAIGDVPFADFATMFFGRFDSPEMEVRKEEIIRGFIEQRFSTLRRLLALVLCWDRHRRIHLLVEIARDPSDPDRASSYAVTRSVASIEDTGSFLYQYESRYEKDLNNFREEEKLGEIEGQ
ncbi:hypothetical protein BKA70DRAFT_684327, partial [Coprinopsis sp. MPI-PUGE-AT-0042]